MRLVPQGDVFEGSDTNGAWRLATRVPRQAVWKCISPSSSGAALGIMQRQSAWLLLMCVVYKALVIPRRSACWCSLSCGSERIPWVVTRDKGLSTWHSLSCGSEWHLLSYGSGLRMNMTNSWVVARVGECYRCECASCGLYGWVQIDCLPQYVADEFGSLGTLRTMFILGTPPSVTEYGL